MEHDDAKLVDVLKSSLQMVHESAGYLLVIGRKYGQVPECPTLNPEGLSVTELEFNEALKLGKPILLFIMGGNHPILFDDIEPDAAKKLKLDAFRERAKLMSDTSKLHRVYATFNSVEEFAEQLGSSLSELRDELVKQPAIDSATTDTNVIPKAPSFYAEPDYIGSHQFVGRQAELDALSDWANRSDPTNLLLFEAIGGNGKSMLTWEWTTKHATTVRSDWAGRFWYSFYERGAIMQDFCQRALAYMTGRPLKEFDKRKTAELKDELIAQLHVRPWLLILDGLERVLVAYHRIDAAEVPDEEANAPTDKILNRNPCDAIRDEDSDLLRAVTACAPSKILVSSRLTPRVLLNPAGQPIPGAKRITLPGLRPPDAEKLLRSCGITGGSAAIQDYLQQNCDNHPLVIGILAGLIANYLPDRGNFDAWSVDPRGGAALDLGKLDLIQRRNHILHAAIADLPDASRQLLSTLALLSDSADYETLKAFNPHLPSEPEEIEEPEAPQNDRRWKRVSEKKKADWQKLYETALARRQEYEIAMESWRNSEEVRGAPTKLAETVCDLEQRGLLQYDHREKRHDIHPVVRGVVAGRLNDSETQRFGATVIDYFSRQAHMPWAHAESLHDLKPGIQVVRTFIKMGRLKEAYWAYSGPLAQAMKFNVEANAMCLTLMRPFFPNGWDVAPTGFELRVQSYLANEAGVSLRQMGHSKEALDALGLSLMTDLREADWSNVRTDLCNIAYAARGRAKPHLYFTLAFEIASLNRDSAGVFVSGLDLYRVFIEQGMWDDADSMWGRINAMGRSWPRHVYRPGTAEQTHAEASFYRGSLDEAELMCAEQLAREGKNRGTLRDVAWLRSKRLLEACEWTQAVEAAQESVRLSREIGESNMPAETRIALAKIHLGQLIGDDARSEAERLAQLRQPAHRYLAMLWLAIGDNEQAKHHALAA